MRPALRANAASRGKIHVRCCHGRIASAWSQRHTVLSLIVATIPARRTSRAISAVLRRESGTPSVAGNSHARALTWTTTSGGESSGTARAGTLVEAGQAFIEEPLAPQANDVASDREGGGNLVIAAALSGGQDNERPEHLTIWQRILAGAALESLAFGA